MDLFEEFRRHPDLVQQPDGKGEATAWCPWHPDREGGKWRKHYNRQMRGRKVAVIPDNDPAGIAHALNVATEVHTTADTVRLLTLPDVPEKGDVSDWMDAGHAVEELLALLNVALPFEPEPPETEPEAEYPDWRISPMMNDANKVTTRLNRHGFFVNGGADAFFFDRDSRQLVYLEKDDRELRLLLGERYQVNRQDQFYAYLVEHLLREAHIRGNHSLVRKFSYYDEEKTKSCWIWALAGYSRSAWTPSGYGTTGRTAFYSSQCRNTEVDPIGWTGLSHN